MRSDLAWQDAAKTIPCAGDNDLIYTGEDKSGNGNDVIASVSGTRPTYQTNQIGPCPIWRFDGSDDLLIKSALPWSTEEVTVFAVAKFVSKAYGMFVCYGMNDDGTWNFRQHPTGGPISDVSGYGNDGAIGTIDRSGAWHIIEGKQISNDFTVYTDGAQDGIGSTFGMQIVAHSPKTLYIAAREDGFNTNMDMAEIVLYNSALSDSDRLLVENYFNDRYEIY